MQYMVISFIGGYILTLDGVSFENVFFTILPGHILYVECPFSMFRHLYGRTYYAQLSSQNRRTESFFFHLNNILNVPLNFKENCTLRYAF